MINAVSGISPFALDMLKGLSSGPSATSPTSGTVTGQINQTSFASILGGITSNMVQDIRTAETTSLNGIMGKVSTREVVDAVMAADQSLQTATAFRDKLVSAYLDITKMPI